jgi:hypothetical protein
MEREREKKMKERGLKRIIEREKETKTGRHTQIHRHTKRQKM